MDKGHGRDQLSIKMIVTCADSIIFSLKLKLKSMINDGVFSEDWKRGNVREVMFLSCDFSALRWREAVQDAKRSARNQH